MKKGLLKNILGDIFTTGTGAALGFPTIEEGIHTLPTDRTTGIIKIIIGVGTLLLGLLTTTKPQNGI
tara:strand:- start:274 stop:474 length:201 start_codon:yes stop_codon:yes gene_type:complete